MSRAAALARKYVAVVGPGDDASAEEIEAATRAAALVAARGWVTLNGGRAAGVMKASADGAASAGGISVGLLPDADRSSAAPALTVALATGLGEARNAVLIAAADAIVVCGMNAGTLSELALAVRAGKPTALIRPGTAVQTLVADLRQPRVQPFDAAATAVAWIAAQLGEATG